MVENEEVYAKREFKAYGILELILIAIYVILMMADDIMEKEEMSEIIRINGFFAGLFLPILIIICGRMCIEHYCYLKFSMKGKTNDKHTFYISFAVAGVSTLLYFPIFMHCHKGMGYRILSYFMLIFMLLNWYECLKKLLYLVLKAKQKKLGEVKNLRLYVDEIFITLFKFGTFFNILSTISYFLTYWGAAAQLWHCMVLKLAVMAGWLFCWIYSSMNCNKRRFVLPLLFLILMFIEGTSTYYAASYAYVVR